MCNAESAVLRIRTIKVWKAVNAERVQIQDVSVPANTFITGIAGIGGYLPLPLVALVAPFVWLADSPQHMK